MARTKPQLDLFAPKRSAKLGVSKRRGKNAPKLGRRPRPERVGMLPHVARPEHQQRHPVHVSMKRVRLAPSFRSERVHRVVVREIARAVKRGVKVVDYSIQDDHLHLLVEGADKQELARGLKLLFSRVAFAVNGVAHRHGSLFRERHHRRELTTPTEVRRVLVYILFNTRKHDIQHGRSTNAIFALDAKTSGPWFEGWDPLIRPSPEAFQRARAEQPLPHPICAAPSTWLASVGWRRAGGPIRFNEVPRLVM